MDVRELNQNFETIETTVTILQNKWTRLCGVDGGRWSIYFSVGTGVSGVSVSTQNLNNSAGFPLVSPFLRQGFTAAELPGGVAGNWYGFTTAVSSIVVVIMTRDIRVPFLEDA